MKTNNIGRTLRKVSLIFCFFSLPILAWPYPPPESCIPFIDHLPTTAYPEQDALRQEDNELAHSAQQSLSLQNGQAGAPVSSTPSLSSLAAKRDAKPSLASLASRSSIAPAQVDRPVSSLSRLAAKARTGLAKEGQNGALNIANRSLAASSAPAPAQQAATPAASANAQKPLSKLQQRALQGRNKDVQAAAKPSAPVPEPDSQMEEVEALPESSLFSALPAGKTKSSAFANVLAPNTSKTSVIANQALLGPANPAGFQAPSPDDLFVQARAMQSFKTPLPRK